MMEQTAKATDPGEPRGKAGAGASVAKGWLRALELTSRIGRVPGRTLPTVIAEAAKAHGDRPALLSDRESFSFAELAERANRYARWALRQGIAADETVCLIMPNRPEYMAIWLGITQIGGIVAHVG